MLQFRAVLPPATDTTLLAAFVNRYSPTFALMVKTVALQHVSLIRYVFSERLALMQHRRTFPLLCIDDRRFLSLNCMVGVSNRASGAMAVGGWPSFFGDNFVPLLGHSLAAQLDTHTVLICCCLSV